jgi:chemotaxis protein methyltransferase CheR
VSELELLESAITAHYGLIPRSSWAEELAKGLDHLARHTKASVETLVKQLISDRHRLRELCGWLTVGESYFFRDEEDFSHLISRIAQLLPDLAPGDRITLWSAGCSRGEEPYSAAIALARRFSRTDLDRIRIMATDINPVAVADASGGVYTRWSLRGVPEHVIQRFFHSRGQDRYQLAASVSQMVSFHPLAITEHLQLLATASIELVLFRNVAIYLDAETLDRIYQGIHRVLKPDGILYIGASDPRPSRQLFASTAGARVCTLSPRRRERQNGSPCREAPTPIPLSRPDRQQARQPEPSVDAYADHLTPTEALPIAEELIERSPASKIGFLLRGRIKLDGMRLEEALSDLRRALFFDPADRIGRYWYAQALQMSGKTRKALVQLHKLCERLESEPKETLLEDGATACGELLAAADSLRRSIE